MSKVKGFFQAPPVIHSASPGLIRAELDVPTAMNLDKCIVKFEIDTGCPYVLLLDADFRTVVDAMGYQEAVDGPLIAWMNLRTDLFRRTRSASTPGGRMNGIFLILYANIRFCRGSGDPANRATRWWPVHCQRRRENVPIPAV